MKPDVCIAIRVGSPHSTTYLVKKTLDSIARNIGTDSWRILLSIGDNIPTDVASYVNHRATEDAGRVRILEKREVTWAEFINKAIDASDDSKYFIKSHDDIELLTPNYLSTVNNELERIGDEVGWVSISDDGWRRGDFSPSVRPGYHIDVRREGAWERKQIFDLHSLPAFWWRASWLRHNLHRCRSRACRLAGTLPPPYPKPRVAESHGHNNSLPQATTRCHAPFNHFVLIKLDTLRKIGPCEDWGTKNALLVDEDWGLRALELRLPNIWIPNLHYYHNKGDGEAGGTRSLAHISNHAERVDGCFKAKWGFSSKPTESELAYIVKHHAGNLIPWSTQRRSYAWDYI